jgi:hypothetical protein
MKLYEDIQCILDGYILKKSIDIEKMKMIFEISDNFNNMEKFIDYCRNNADIKTFYIDPLKREKLIIYIEFEYDLRTETEIFKKKIEDELTAIIEHLDKIGQWEDIDFTVSQIKTRTRNLIDFIKNYKEGK